VRELELKLSVGETFVMPDFVNHDGIGSVRDLPELELGSVYYDTSDLRLARHGVSLRYRIGEDSGPHWTLKIPGPQGAALERDEIDFEAGPAEVPAPAREAVAAWVRRAPLAPSAALRTRRRRVLLMGSDGTEIAEVANDEVTVLDDDEIAARFRELEVEARSASRRELSAIGRLLQQAGAGPTEPMPKYVRALGPRATAAPDVIPPSADRQADIETATRAAIAADAAWLIRHHAPTTLGDAEGLHQMRVAARRLRSDLRTFGPFLDSGWTHALDAELEWVADLLAAVRDADVHLEMIESQGSDLQPGIAALVKDVGRRRETARATLVRELGGSRYLDLVDRLVGAARAPLLRRGIQGRAGKLLEPQVLAAAKKVAKAADRLDQKASDRAFHRVRIRAKRLRYAAEKLEPYVDNGRAAARVAARAAKLQDVLGMLQDAVTLRDSIDRFTNGRAQSNAATFAAGRLAERQEAARLTLRARVPKRWRGLRKAIDDWRDDS
jgi:inorganic triphosphatase YgiF